MLRFPPRRGRTPHRRADPKLSSRPHVSCRLPESMRCVSVCTVSDCPRGLRMSSALAPVNTGRQQHRRVAASGKGLLIMQMDAKRLASVLSADRKECQTSGSKLPARPAEGHELLGYLA
jgi:hypothetical protein